MVVLVVLVCVAVAHYGGAYEEYVVQNEPVIFLSHPLSHIILNGTTVTLTCQARIVSFGNLIHVDSLYPVPTIEWSINDGTITTGTMEGLQISSLSVSDSGWYQCLATDGIDNFNGNGHYVTISNPARIDVVDNNQTIVEISVNDGQPLVLRCHGNGYHIRWTHNNTVIYQNSDIVITRDYLMLPSVSHDHRGVWSCTTNTWDNVTVTLTAYDVTITLNDITDEHLMAIIQPTIDTSLTLGHQVILVCVGGSPTGTVWYHDNQLINEADTGSGWMQSINQFTINNNQLIIEKLNGSYYGNYRCEYTHNQTIASEDYYLAADTTLPVIAEPQTNDIYLSIYDTLLSLSCTVHGTADVIWYKNGAVLNSTLYDGSVLHVTDKDVPSLYGIYQCYALNDAGRAEILYRVLVETLSNPPANITVTARTYRNQPILDISWTPPTLTGGSSPVVYTLSIEDDDFKLHGSDPSIQNTHYTLTDIPEGHYLIILQVTSMEGIQSPNVYCEIDTRNRFYASTNEAVTLTPSLYSYNTVQYIWKPASDNLSQRPVQYVTVTWVCIHGNHIIEDNENYEELSKMLNLTHTGLSPGTICRYTGQYKPVARQTVHCGITDSSFASIPVRTVIMPYTEPSYDSWALLNSTCNGSSVYVLWSVSEDMLCFDDWSNDTFNISGACSNGSHTVMFEEQVNVTVLMGGVVLFDNIPTDSICSFTAGDDNTTVTSSYCRSDAIISEQDILLDTSFIQYRLDCVSGSSSTPLTTLSVPSMSSKPVPTTTFHTDSTIAEVSPEASSIDTSIALPLDRETTRDIIIAVVVTMTVGTVIVIVVITAIQYLNKKHLFSHKLHINEQEILEVHVQKFKFSDDTSSIKTIECPLTYDDHSTLNTEDNVSPSHTSSKIQGLDNVYPKPSDVTAVVVDQNWFSVTNMPITDTTGSSGYDSESSYIYYHGSYSTIQKDSVRHAVSLPCIIDEDEPNTKKLP